MLLSPPLAGLISPTFREPRTGTPEIPRPLEPFELDPDCFEFPLLSQKPPASGSSGLPSSVPPTIFQVPKSLERLSLPKFSPWTGAPPLIRVPDPCPSPGDCFEPCLFSQKPPASGSRGVPAPSPPMMFQVPGLDDAP